MSDCEIFVNGPSTNGYLIAQSTHGIFRNPGEQEKRNRNANTSRDITQQEGIVGRGRGPSENCHERRGRGWRVELEGAGRSRSQKKHPRHRVEGQSIAGVENFEHI